MAFIFMAIAVTRSHSWGDAKASVYQQRSHGELVHIGYVQNRGFDGDLQELTMEFSEGTLSFHEVHDLPLPFYDTEFQKENGKSSVSLHKFYSNHSYRTYLRTEDGYYPVVKERKSGPFRATVYTPFEATQFGASHTVFAEIFLTHSQGFTDYYEYHLNTIPDTDLLMAIFSLPWTL